MATSTRNYPVRNSSYTGAAHSRYRPSCRPLFEDEDLLVVEDFLKSRAVSGNELDNGEFPVIGQLVRVGDNAGPCVGGGPRSVQRSFRIRGRSRPDHWNHTNNAMICVTGIDVRLGEPHRCERDKEQEPNGHNPPERHFSYLIQTGIGNSARATDKVRTSPISALEITVRTCS